ncbi:MAG: (p)ppGpp synthetase [Eubacteriales bacterium]|nr:(p)ppGpp synthetase [Eubacteriales bacterium]
MTEEEYRNLIEPYKDALSVMQGRFTALGKTLYGPGNEPIHDVVARVKSRESIERKLMKRGMEPSAENARDHLQDIAGIRVITYFTDDIKALSDNLRSQTDLVYVRESDYVLHPKPNGYRSFHIVLGVPLYYMDAMEYFPVEIQLRTLTMDLWAAMEHRILYKKNIENADKVAIVLKDYANRLAEIEDGFESFACRNSREENRLEDNKSDGNGHI